MHFIQVKVGKQTNSVPLGKLDLALNFAARQGMFQAFQNNVCGMLNPSQDVAFQRAAVSAGVDGVPGPPSPAPAKVYELISTFELVTSRKVPSAVRTQLHAAGIQINTTVKDPSCWGPRVKAYCDSTKFVLFQ